VKSTTKKTPSIQTQHNVGEVLRDWKENCPRKKFNHLAYRTVWVCEMMGAPPARTALDIVELRKKIAALDAAQVGMAKHSLDKLVWAFCYMVENSPYIDPHCKHHSIELSPEWVEILEHAWSPHIRGTLSRLAYFCSRRAIAPKDFDARTFATFEAFWRSTRLVPTKTYHHPVLAHLWNELVMRAPDLKLKPL
jgi:hypothetical protein